MVIKNTTRKVVLSKKAKTAQGFKDKTFGLIFEKGRKSLLINTRFGIHTHLMNTPIDIIVLDKNNRIVKLKKNLSPNRIFLWNPKFSKVIELPQKTLDKSGTKVGDKIEATQ